MTIVSKVSKGLAAAAVLPALALVSINAQAGLLVNPGFDGPEVNTLSDVTVNSVTNLAAGVWHLGGNDNSDAWGVSNNTAVNYNGVEAQGLFQYVNDGSVAQGAGVLSFDLLMDSGISGDYDFAVYTFGWNADAAGIDFENTWVSRADSFTPNGSTSLINAPTDLEGRLRLAWNGAAVYSDVQDSGVFNTATVDLDFGTGFDYIGVLFYGENGGTGQMVLDNVQVSAVSEPATLALLGMAMFGFGAFRKSKASA